MLGGSSCSLYVADGETEVKSRNKNMLNWDLNLWSATADVILHTQNYPAERDKNTPHWDGGTQHISTCLSEQRAQPLMYPLLQTQKAVMM